MSNKMNFIKTSDLDTARRLRDLGFTELTEPSSSTFCFINDGKIVYDDVNDKCVYTNILCI